MKHVVLAISGPTGSGKTEWGIRLAKELNGVIIVADSRTVYRSIDIGTNKVTYEYPFTERQSAYGPVYRIQDIDHYGLNICPPTEQFTASDFQKFAYQLFPVLWEQKKVPILVGGTGLYIESVIEGYQFPGRAQLSSEWRERKTVELLQELQIWDPQTAESIDIQNRTRIERALAFAFATGRSFTAVKKKSVPDFTSGIFVINPDRARLYEKLDRRMEYWLDDGLLDEVRALQSSGISDERIARFGFMYRIALQRVRGSMTEEMMRQKLRTELKHFVKRQITWWKRHPKVVWVTKYSELLRAAKKILKEGK